MIKFPETIWAAKFCTVCNNSMFFLVVSKYLVLAGDNCHRRRRAYAPVSNTASHDNEKINSQVSFSFPYEYGALLDLELRDLKSLFIIIYNFL